MSYLQKKKLAFMAVVNKVKGFVRSVVGIPSLTLPNAVGESLLDYKVYGNSKQNGTPSPDAPVEIESVGDKSVNLLPFPYEIKSSSTTNGVTYTINDDRSITVSGTATGYSDFCFLWQAQITELGGTVGDTLYFSLNATDLKNIVGVININIGGTITSPTFTTSYKLEITEDNVNALITFSIKRNHNVATSGVICPMISKKATDYEPYGYYKVPIKVTGKNLFNKNDAGSIVVGYVDNTKYQEATTTKSVCIPCKPNTTYAISKSIVSSRFIVGCTANKPKQGETILTRVGASGNKTATITTTADSNYLVVWVYHSSYDTVDILYEVLNSLQIEEGTTATTYEPYKDLGTTNIYLDEPLRKAGNYADYVDFSNGCVVRNTQKINCLSNKAYLYTYSGMNGVRFDSTLQEGGQRYTGFCTHSDKVYFKNQQGEVWCGANGNTSVYWIGILDLLGFATVAEFKTWLDAQETPLEVICGRATPITEPIELPTIPTAKGTTTLTVNTTTQPSGMDVTYYSSI